MAEFVFENAMNRLEEITQLLQNDKRDALLREMGLTTVGCSFARIKDMSPKVFVEQVLADELNAAFVACGYNYRFGKNGAGDAAALQMPRSRASASAMPVSAPYRTPEQNASPAPTEPLM